MKYCLYVNNYRYGDGSELFEFIPNEFYIDKVCVYFKLKKENYHHHLHFPYVFMA
jgi:hypothetical protein